MKRPTTSFSLSLALAAAIAVGAPAPAQAAPPAPAARAADLYRQATHLYSSRNLREAEPLYQQAWELQQSYDIASNLGALELELGKPRRAAELLAFAVNHFPVRGRAEDRAALEERLSQAKSRVGTIRVKVEPGAEIRLDGAVVGRAPLAPEVFVDPGAHVILARLAGYADTRVTFQVRAGAALDVRLPLSAPPPPPPAPSMAPALAMGATSLLSAGAGVALIVLAQGQRSRAEDLHDKIQSAGASCAGTYPGCDDLRSATARSDLYSNAGVGLFAVAGAFAVGTATYLLAPRLKLGGGGKRDVRATLGVSPAGGAAVITGSF